MPENIYLASSWRNERQPAVLSALREWGHTVYDFRNPGPDNAGFSWKQLGADAPEKIENATQLRIALDHPVARRGFSSDYEAMIAASVCVLLLPCGRSAHLELGWCIGMGKRCVVLAEVLPEPELMYLLCQPGASADKSIVRDLGELRDWLHFRPERFRR